MRLSFRVPMFVWAAALLGLIVALATLQYRWLGQISAAERERMKATLSTSATGVAYDFDREVTRAYATFQVDSLHEGESLATRLAERYERWQQTSRYPRLVKDIYVAPGGETPVRLQRFHPGSRFVEPVEWPQALHPIRDRLAAPPPRPVEGGPAVRLMPSSLWEDVPAVMVPTPMLFFNASSSGGAGAQELTIGPAMTYTIVVFDREYLRDEMLPALTQQHFRSRGDDTDYRIAVVNADDGALVYSHPSGFAGDAQADVEAPLFQIRAQEFAPMVAEVRRFTSFVTRTEAHADAPRGQIDGGKPGEPRLRMVLPPDAANRISGRDGTALSIVVQQGAATPGERRSIETAAAAATAAVAGRQATPGRWRLVVKHPSGSLETAVANVRRRNLVVSSGILAVLGVSIGFLVVSTRRAQELARQQMEFVAAVSHELRTPLAVIRSAADNLAEGVVREETQVRRYGELVRGEGRRLSEMVEQILELAGIHSGQRGFALRPVHVVPLLHEVVRASEQLIADAGMDVESDVQDGLPPVLGEEQALRRVFVNLLGNAIKYGADGRWIGIRARSAGREVQITFADRGMGIDPAEQAHVFEPFYRAPRVIAAQIHGAGLGLSLVQRIVEAHNGRITLRSAPGEGSEFTVHVPAASEEPVSSTVTASDTAQARS